MWVSNNTKKILIIKYFPKRKNIFQLKYLIFSGLLLEHFYSDSSELVCWLLFDFYNLWLLNAMKRVREWNVKANRPFIASEDGPDKN